MRTGSIGNRNAEEMVRTLTPEKKQAISSIRSKLLESGYLEDTEYDAVNVEPVLKYSKGEMRMIFVKHKWELSAMIPMNDSKKGVGDAEFGEIISNHVITDEEGNRWIKFQLPAEESKALVVLETFSE